MLVNKSLLVILISFFDLYVDMMSMSFKQRIENDLADLKNTIQDKTCVVASLAIIVLIFTKDYSEYTRHVTSRCTFTIIVYQLQMWDNII